MSNDLYNVKNRSAGMVVYSVPELGVRRVFSPGETKRITFNELEALSFIPGGKEIIANYLQVRSAQVLEELNVHTEPEYFMDRDQVIELIKTGTLDQFMDALDFAPAGVIELIKTLSVELPVDDFNKRKAIKDKLGYDIDAAIKNSVKDDSADEVVAPAISERRRASTPIIDKAAMEESAAAAPVRKYKVISQN